MSGRQGQMWRNERGGTQVTAGGFQLPDSVPRRLCRVSHLYAIVMTKNSVFIFSASALSVAGLSACATTGSKQSEPSNTAMVLCISRSGGEL